MRRRRLGGESTQLPAGEPTGAPAGAPTGATTYNPLSVGVTGAQQARNFRKAAKNDTMNFSAVVVFTLFSVVIYLLGRNTEGKSKISICYVCVMCGTVALTICLKGIIFDESSALDTGSIIPKAYIVFTLATLSWLIFLLVELFDVYDEDENENENPNPNANPNPS